MILIWDENSNYVKKTLKWIRCSDSEKLLGNPIYECPECREISDIMESWEIIVLSILDFNSGNKVIQMYARFKIVTQD